MFDWFRIILNPSKRETSQFPNLDECSMRMVIQRLEILSVSYLLSERFGDGNVITQFFKTGLPHNNFHSTCEDNAPYHCEETHKKQSKERPCNLEMEYPWTEIFSIIPNSGKELCLVRNKTYPACNTYLHHCVMNTC